MTNRSKALGTWFETKTVEWLNVNGFPNALRVAQLGSKDIGDIRLEPGLIAECKGGHMAENATPKQIEKWLTETIAEVGHAGAEFGFLVVKKPGVGAPNAGRWRAFCDLAHFMQLIGLPKDQIARYCDIFYGGDSFLWRDACLEMTLQTMALILRASGWGEPIENNWRVARTIEQAEQRYRLRIEDRNDR